MALSILASWIACTRWRCYAPTWTASITESIAMTRPLPGSRGVPRRVRGGGGAYPLASPQKFCCGLTKALLVLVIWSTEAGCAQSLVMEPPKPPNAMRDAVGMTGPVTELAVPRAANSAHAAELLLDRRQTAGLEQVIAAQHADALRRITRQVLHSASQVTPHLFQVESALRFDEPGGQTLMLICLSCGQPVATLVTELSGSITPSGIFRLGAIDAVLERASARFRAAPRGRPPVMQLPQN